jgi:predicted Rossmann-fold nucleotide-binding protein
MWTSASLGMHQKPVILLDPDGFYAPLWEYLYSLRDKGFVRQAALDVLHRVTSVDDALALIDAAAA